MKKTKLKNVDITISKDFRVICMEKDHLGKWTTESQALNEAILHQRKTHQTHEVKIEKRVTEIHYYSLEQFLSLK